jgi:hypothetical protein
MAARQDCISRTTASSQQLDGGRRVRPAGFDVLRRLCTGDPPSRLHALHSRVSGLVREANSGADAVIGAPWVLLADGDSLARETLLDLSAEESAAW